MADSTKVKGSVPESGSEPFTLILSEDSFANFKIDKPSKELTFTKDELIHMYSEMVKMRRMEVASDQAYKNKLVR